MPGATTFGQWLKQRRKALDLSQEELAERLNCSDATIRKIEAGERRPSKQLAELLADFCKVPAEEREAFISFARGIPTGEEEPPHSPYDAASNGAAEQQITSPTGNLPAPLTRLIGREEVATRIGSLLLQEDVRMLSLTGPPGIGKTSLAMHVAVRLRSHFRDGVYFVALAPVVDPAVVPATIAEVLHLHDLGSRTPSEMLTHALRDTETLLLLDNFEQVVESAPAIADILTTTSGVKALVTSREPLRVRGERVFLVPPLQVSEVIGAPSLEALSHTPAVALFVERAQALVPEFALTEQNAAAVAYICLKLEGIPLAIELAAARVRMLTPQEIQTRLESRLTLLRGGARDLPARQQTLRDAIDWSYSLLSVGERELFARLAVFNGGCTFPAAEAICNERGDLPFSVLEGLISLFDKSLLKREEVLGESRYTMLEMIREYAAEQLERSGAAAEMKRCHAEYHLLFAEAAASQIDTPEQAVWLSRLESMHDNMRAALQWTQSPAGDAHFGLRLAVALAPFWTVHSHFHEAREWFSRILSRLEGQPPTILLAGAYARAGRLAFRQSDFAAARHYYHASLAIGEELGDMRSVGIALAGLGDVATEQGDVVEASGLYEKGLATFRDLDDPLLLADCLVGAGWASMEQGNYALATGQFEEAMALCRRKENKELAAWALSGLGEVAVRQGDYTRAIALLEESLILRREIDDRWGIAIALEAMAWAVLRRADYARAKELLRESILMREDLGDKAGIAQCLERFAEIESRQGGSERAATLYAAAHAIRQSVALAADSLDRWSAHERNITLVRAQLDPASWDTAWEAGQSLSMAQAVAYVLQS